MLRPVACKATTYRRNLELPLRVLLGIGDKLFNAFTYLG